VTFFAQEAESCLRAQQRSLELRTETAELPADTGIIDSELRLQPELLNISSGMSKPSS